MVNLASHTTRFQQLLKKMQRPIADFVQQRALDRYSLLAERLLAQLAADRQGQLHHSPKIVKAIRTRSDVAVFFLGEAGVVTKVLKLPLTADAIQSTSQHRQVVLALHERAELGSFCDLVPQPLAWGNFEGQDYYLETALAGATASDLVRQHNEPAAFKASAAYAIRQLHRATMQRYVVDELIFSKLAANEFALMYRLAEQWPNAPQLHQQLKLFEEQLRQELLGRELPFGWVHGDYWPGNLLIDPLAGTVGGIIDWDRASDNQLPLLDLLHLLAFTRKMQQHTELGEEVANYLLSADLGPTDRLLIEEACTELSLPKHPEFLVAASLLYWLRFAAANLLRYPGLQKDAHWLNRNVFVVLKRDL